MTADGVGANEIGRQAGVAETAVWRWQEGYMQAGVGGLLYDKTRPSRIAPLASEVATYWTAAAMVKVDGVSISSVQCVWRAHGLQPHRMQ